MRLPGKVVVITGEGSATASPPAIADATNDDLAPLGAYLNRQPFTPLRVVAAIQAAAR
jgi:aerobic carbon-monoxide dehydrogenase large subunit